MDLPNAGAPAVDVVPTVQTDTRTQSGHRDHRGHVEREHHHAGAADALRRGHLRRRRPLADLEAAGADILCKGPPAARAGRALTQGRFKIETAAGSVTCPGGVTAPRRPVKAGGGTAAFVAACRGCPLAAQCTTSAPLRRFTIGRYEAELARARTTQADPA